MDLTSPVELPYLYAGELPGPLPTFKEICDANAELSPRRHAWGRGGVCLIRNYIVKYGDDVTENEGNALLYIRKSRIPAPRLYAMYRESTSGYLYLIMEYIQGDTLGFLWGSLSIEAKSSITTQLHAIFMQIRSLTSPSFIGSICGGSIPDAIFQTEDPDPKINGPFQTTAEVASALALASRNNWERNGRCGWISDYLSRHLPITLGDFEVKLTHGDLHMRNIIIEKVPEEPDLEGSRGKTGEGNQRWSYRVAGIVDWESAGWYPAYWDYVSAIARSQSDSDWPKAVDAIIEPYPLEACMFLLLLRDLQIIY